MSVLLSCVALEIELKFVVELIGSARIVGAWVARFERCAVLLVDGVVVERAAAGLLMSKGAV